MRKMLVPKYKHTGLQPINLAHQSLNKKTPILIISVKDDNKILQCHQIALYAALKKTGHDVYFYEIQQGDHDTLTKKHDQAQSELRSVIQRFRDYIELQDTAAEIPFALQSLLTQLSLDPALLISQYSQHTDAITRAFSYTGMVRA